MEGGRLGFQANQDPVADSSEGQSARRGLRAQRLEDVARARGSALHALRAGGQGSGCGSASCGPEAHPTGCCTEDSRGADGKDCGVARPTRDGDCGVPVRSAEVWVIWKAGPV